MRLPSLFPVRRMERHTGQRSTARHRTIAAVLVGIASCVSVSGAGAESAGEAAMVIAARGIAAVSYPQSSARAFIRKGYLLHSGARIETGKKGFVSLKYISSGTSFILRPNSEITIGMIEDTTGIQEFAEITTGECYCRVTAGKKRTVDIHIPNGIISGEQGECFVSADEKSGVSAAFLVSGNLRITDTRYESWYAPDSATVVFCSDAAPMSSTAMSSQSLPAITRLMLQTKRFETGDPLTHRCTIEQPPNGRVSPAGLVTLLSGVAVDLTARPDSGYVFAGWRRKSGIVHFADPARDSTTLTCGSDAVISPAFAEKPSRLFLLVEGNGVCSPAGTLSVERDNPLTITHVPARGHVFDTWKTRGRVAVAVVDSGHSTIRVTGDHATAVAEFVKKRYPVTVHNDGHGTTEPAGSIDVAHGDTLSLTAHPNKGFYFVYWELLDGVARPRDPRSTSTIMVCDSGGATVRARFASIVVKATIQEHERAAVFPSGTFYAEKKAEFPVSVVPQQGFEFKEMAVLNGEVTSSGRAPVLVKPVSSFTLNPVVVTAQYRLHLETRGRGTLESPAAQNVYHNTPVTMTAQPDSGNFFVRWQVTGGWADIEQPFAAKTRVTLNRGDAHCAALFAESICTLHVAATKGGHTEPSGAVTMVDGGMTELLAVPNPKAAFLGWEIEAGEKHCFLSDTLTERGQFVTCRGGDAHLIARFSTETVEMTILANGLGKTDPGEGSHYVVVNKWNAIHAVPNEGRRFAQWTAVSGADIQFKDRLSPETEVLFGSGDGVVKAIFLPAGGDDELTADSTGLIDRDYTLRIDIDEAQGTIAGEKVLTLRHGIPVSLAAKPSPGYRFDSWIVVDGTATISSPSTAQTTVSLFGGDAILGARFLPKEIRILSVEFFDYQNRSKTVRAAYR